MNTLQPSDRLRPNCVLEVRPNKQKEKHTQYTYILDLHSRLTSQFRPNRFQSQALQPNDQSFLFISFSVVFGHRQPSPSVVFVFSCCWWFLMAGSPVDQCF